jgi:hypothetical protein
VNADRFPAHDLVRPRAEISRISGSVDVCPAKPVESLRFDPLTPTVFHERWWLEAATGGRYRETTVSAGGRMVARFPYVLNRTVTGHTLCSLPVLTHFLGPAIDAGSGTPANRALKTAGILRDLLAQMPRTSGFYQKLHRETNDTLVFQEQAYSTAVQFTYEILPEAESAIWSNLRDKTRNAIRRAEAIYTVADMVDPHRFAALYQAHLAGRGVANHYPRIAAVCAAALEHGRGRILAAHDQTGSPVAAIFYAWDARTAYYVFTTRHDRAGNGAVSLLLWRAILDSTSRGLLFDFDGVAEPGSRVFYTGFGGRVAPRYIVFRYSLGYRVAHRLSNPFRGAIKHRYQY